MSNKKKKKRGKRRRSKPIKEIIEEQAEEYEKVFGDDTKL